MPGTDSRAVPWQQKASLCFPMEPSDKLSDPRVAPCLVSRAIIKKNLALILQVASNIRINAQLAIPRRELRFTFVRSSGPGGQNVNKVASKAVLRWSVAGSPSLSDEARDRLRSRLSRRINDRGELVLASQRFRDQTRNIEDCLEKFRLLILGALKTHKPRKKSRPTKAAREARLFQKRTAAEKKQRRAASFDD